mmetsp:Transcript_71273/g.230829  ORF Transcript_71273/g.230829 Transcript_71273/m.230829 type:complete len:297 (-) Transcript_71273:272-1162(-)
MESSQASVGLQRPQAFHTMSLGLLVMLPTLMFLMISLFVVFLFHSVQPVIWVVVAICLLVSLVFMSARKVHMRDSPNFWLNLGSLCALATVAATAASLYNWQRHLARYWAYEGQRAYTNVLPSEPALSHLDAGRLLFSADARLDFAGAGVHGDSGRLCVAPILGSAPQATVEYWAAGVGCCGPAGNFSCGAADDNQARGGLVFLTDGAAAGLLDGFRRAARHVGAARGLPPSADALFVQWVADPQEAQRGIWGEGMRFLVGSAAAYLGLSVVAGTALHCCRRAPAKSRLEDRRFAP